MPKLLGAVESPTHETVSMSAEGMGPLEGERGENVNWAGCLPRDFSLFFTCIMLMIQSSLGMA